MEVIEFMSGVVNYFEGARIIDPAGGSGDFLVGAAKRSRTQNIKTVNLDHWDLSEEASEVAQLNLLLNGISDASFQTTDSIANFSESMEQFDFVLTNPPFGTRTIWSHPKPISTMENYDLGHRWQDREKTDELVRQQLGMLFVERALKLLKPGGALAIVLPSGYLTNPSESYFRKWLSTAARIVGVVSLPAGTFKKSGAGVTCDILFLQKPKGEKTESNYNIFVGTAKRIGFDFRKSNTPKIFKRKIDTGEYVTDETGQLVPDNDLVELALRFRSFAKASKLSAFAHEESEESRNFDSVSLAEFVSNSDLVLSPKRFSQGYIDTVSRIQKLNGSSLERINAKVSTSDCFSPIKSNEYIYLDIGEIGWGTYRIENLLRGWELPGRAKQSLAKNDIVVARLAGSGAKFALISSEHENLVATNGLFRIRIEDEIERLTFLHFLHTKEFQIQMEALSTGSIMEDVKIEDFTSKLIFPGTISKPRLEKMRKMVDLQSELFEI
jgi:type I restriction enzyme M protein